MVNDQPISFQLIMAEISKGSIKRFLDDHIPVQSLDKTKGEIYIFEVPAVPPSSINVVEAFSQEKMDTFDDVQQLNNISTLKEDYGQKTDFFNDDLLSIEELQLLSCNQNVSTSACSNNTQETSHRNCPDISTWHTCQICLEEMMDFDLIVHASCGGSLCKTCKDQLSAYHKGGVLQCPVCSQVVNLSVDFVPLAAQSEKGEVVKNISVPVLFRFENLSDDVKFTMSNHPVVIILPTQVKACHVYRLISDFLSVVTTSVTEHQIVLVGSQGLYCSRCDFSRKCSGCPLSRDDVLKLKPGDHIAVTLIDNRLYNKLNEVVEHSSMKDKTNVPITIEDCLSCFHEKEELGKDNPWFCTKCNTNQIATRTMSISHYPDTLIIHLKRFYYEGNRSEKLDVGVSFSHVFDLSSFGIDKEQVTSDPCLVYSLQSIVCHKGTLNSGHYTAFVKNTKKGMDSEWYLLNDENVAKEEPSTEDNQFVYMILYQKQNSL